MAKRKLKKKYKRRLIVLILLVIIGIVYLNIHNYHNSYKYKFLKLNYTKEEYEILSNLSNKELDILLTKEYNENIPKLITQKYFIFKKLDRYLNYLDKNENTEEVISLVNVNRDYDYYENTTLTDTAKKEAMLVNKYHVLDKNYEPDNIVTASSSYSYAGNKLNKDAYEAFKLLADDAKKEGHTIVILSSYRTYEYQDNLWKSRKQTGGIKKADSYAARAGSSEHETGYAIDVADFYDQNDSFKDTESFIWMQNNSYKYGYILRYPEGKEEITGYSAEAWHYRYVGTNLATKIYNENITLDEYYEYYLN